MYSYFAGQILFVFQKYYMQKTLSFLVAFFAVLLLREKQKKPFVFPTFLAYVIS